MIPKTVASYCDRHDDSAFLIEALSQFSAVIISGMPGMGKSILLNELFQTLREKDPERCIALIRCRKGWSSGDFFSSISSVLNPFISEEKLCSNSETGRFINCMDKIEAVLMIDDFQYVESAETLFFLSKTDSLLKGKLIASSRTSPDFSEKITSHIYFHKLKFMSETESSDMLKRLFSIHNQSVENETIKKLIAVSGGHPLHIKLLTGMIISGKSSVHNIIEQQSSFSDFENCISQQIFTQLHSESISLLRILSIFRIPVPEHLLSRLYGSDIEKPLNKLDKCCLLEFTADGSIWVHDLTKELVKSGMSETELKDLQKKTSEQLLELSPDVEGHLRECFFLSSMTENKKTALDSLIRIVEIDYFSNDYPQDIAPLLDYALNTLDLDRETVNFYTAKQLIHNRFFDRAKILLSGFSGWKYHYLTGCIAYETGEHVSACASLRKSLTFTADPYQKLLSESQTAASLCLCGETKESLSVIDNLLNNSLLQSWKIIHIFLLHFQTICHYYRGETEPALKSNQQCLKLCDEIRTPGFYNQTVLVRGMVSLVINNYIEAMSLFEECLFNEQKHNNLTLRMSCHVFISSIYLQQECYEKALEASRKALKLASILNVIDHQAIQLACLCFIHTFTGNLEEAAGFQIMADEKSADLDHFSQSLVTLYVSPFLILSGKYSETIQRIRKAVSMEDKIPGKLLCKLLYHLYKSELISENPDEAEKVLNHYQIVLSSFSEEQISVLTKSASGLDRLLTENSRCFQLVTSQMTKTFSDYQSCLDSYNFFAECEIRVNFIENEIRTGNRTINLNNKKIMLSLLKVFITEPGIEKSNSKIFSAVWNRRYNHVSDYSHLRTNISRLRKLLDSENPEHFIQSGQNQNHYLFSNSVSYCFINSLR